MSKLEGICMTVLGVIARSWIAPATRNARPRLTQRTVFLLAFVAYSNIALAQQGPGKPRVPPGVDPGGVAVAIIGSGIDYTRSQFSSRLARDGEGEIIGWDFIDNDRRPYHRCDAGSADPCPIEFLGWLAIADKPARLIFMRAGSDRPQSLVQAVLAAAQTPARVVLLASFPPPPLQFLIEASQRNPGMAFIGVVAGSGEHGAPQVQEANYLGIRFDSATSAIQAARTAARHAQNATSAVHINPALDGQGIMRRLSPPKTGHPW